MGYLYLKKKNLAKSHFLIGKYMKKMEIICSHMKIKEVSLDYNSIKFWFFEENENQ